MRNVIEFQLVANRPIRELHLELCLPSSVSLQSRDGSSHTSSRSRFRHKYDFPQNKPSPNHHRQDITLSRFALRPPMAVPLRATMAILTNNSIVKRSRFLALPAELRLSIYSYLQDNSQTNVTIAVNGSLAFRVSDSPFPDAPALLQACRQLHEDIRDKLYDDTTFTIQVQNHIAGIGECSGFVTSNLDFLHLCRRVKLEVNYDGGQRSNPASKMIDGYEDVLGK